MADFASAVSGNIADDDMDNSQMSNHIEERRKLFVRLENDPEFKKTYEEELRKKEADARQDEAQRLIRELSGGSGEQPSTEPVEEYEEEVQKKHVPTHARNMQRNRQPVVQKHVDLDDLVPDEVLEPISRGGGVVVHIHINHVHNMTITN